MLAVYSIVCGGWYCRSDKYIW